MKISGFTIVRNAQKFNYPVLESIRSLLPICDEFIVNVGDSEDNTLGLVKSLNSPKIKILETKWAKMPDVLSYQTNLALNECKGDWAFYLQSDEVIHEHDLPGLKRLMKENLDNSAVDVFRLRWLHFYGSYYRYRIDYGWFQKQDRIVRNNGNIESCVDAWKFRRKDGKPIQQKHTRCLLYHYGWVQSGVVMAQRLFNADQIYQAPATKPEFRSEVHRYGDLRQFHPYFGTHPSTMRKLVESHEISIQDKKDINKEYWWHLGRWLRIRYKTGRRLNYRIE